MIKGAVLPTSIYLNSFYQHAKMYPKQTSRYLYGIYIYNEQVDESRLKFAIEQLTKGHPVLRTQFKVVEAKLHILFKSNAENLLTTYFVSSLAESTALVNQLVARTFDMTQGDLYKFYLINQEKGSIFIAIFHHIILDGSLFDFFMNLIDTFYEKYPNEYIGENHYEADIKCYLNQEPLNINHKSLNFWSKQLSGFPLNINMPFVDKSIPLEDQKTCTKRFYISPDLTEEIRKFLKNYRVSMFNFLKILWATLIGYYAHQDKLIILHAVSVRGQQFKHLDGCFINILPFALDRNKSLHEELLSTVEILDDLRRYRFLPMEKIIEEFLQMTQETRFENSLKIVFAQTDLRNFPPKFMQENVTALATPNIGSAYLLLEYQLINDQIGFQLNYLSPAIAEKDIMRMKIDFVNLLSSVIKSPYLKLSEHEMNDLECHDLIPITTFEEINFFQHKGAKW